MNSNHDMEILEALIELKSLIQDMRMALSNKDFEDKNSVVPDTNDSDEYQMELTPQEMKALLFSSPHDKESKLSLGIEPNFLNEITDLRNEFIKLREQTEKEFTDLKRSVSVLSEMWGRHELEILKNRKYSGNY